MCTVIALSIKYIALTAALLHRLGGPAPSATLHPLEFIL